METHNIKVYIISEGDPTITKQLFSAKSTSGRVNATVNIIKPIKNEYDSDYFLTYNSLIESENQYVIICKDTAISSSTSENIFNVIEGVINRNIDGSDNSFDIFYMAKWMDRCDQYTNQVDIGDSGMKVVNTISPNGVLCLMFSPNGGKKFVNIYHIDKNPIPVQTDINNKTLGHYLHSRVGLRSNVVDVNQQFYAITTTPSLVNFDISKRKSDDEFIKTVECRNVQKETKNTTTQSSNMVFFWFVIIVLIIIFFIWIIFKYNSPPIQKNAGDSTLYFTNNPQLNNKS